MNRRRWVLGILIVAALVVLPACAGARSMIPDRLLREPAAAVSPISPAAGLNADPQLAAFQGTVESIYNRVSPSVVHIQVVQKQSVSPMQLPELGPGFQLPFSLPQESAPAEPQYQYRQGSGSGFVWDQAGHIVTNNHVVEGAEKIRVIFADGTTVPGELVGTDPDSDLAVIKVDRPAEALQPVELADSTQVRVGQLAIAIGNPFGLEGTLTVGVVSAIGRSLSVEAQTVAGPTYTIPDVIQTDASINPGNSGGVLVDAEGRVMGVTSAIISPVEASAGVGFAIPAAIVHQVVPVLIEDGTYEHPRLGISGTTLTPELAEAMDLKSDRRGALVIEVVPDGPADQAGVRGSDRQLEIDGQTVRVGGDVIVAIDGQPVRRFEDLPAYLARATRVGQTVTLTVLRDGREQELRLTLDARPGTTAEAPQSTLESQAEPAYLGIIGSALTPEIARRMDLAATQTGVLIGQVEEGSPADQAGLRGSYKPVSIDGQRVLIGGDVITAFDGTPVREMDALKALIQQAHSGQKVTLTVLRDGQEQSIEVTLAARPNP